mmetsp:Transcript_42082/g.98745  ORF Transcript_42082/g.98745 Transcript_42082/m.98745 type:complete len:603 (+) Transcript_42082:51-1859(+)
MVGRCQARPSAPLAPSAPPLPPELSSTRSTDLPVALPVATATDAPPAMELATESEGGGRLKEQEALEKALRDSEEEARQDEREAEDLRRAMRESEALMREDQRKEREWKLAQQASMIEQQEREIEAEVDARRLEMALALSKLDPDANATAEEVEAAAAMVLAERKRQFLRGGARRSEFVVTEAMEELALSYLSPTGSPTDTQNRDALAPATVEFPMDPLVSRAPPLASLSDAPAVPESQTATTATESSRVSSQGSMPVTPPPPTALPPHAALSPPTTALSPPATSLSPVPATVPPTALSPAPAALPPPPTALSPPAVSPPPTATALSPPASALSPDTTGRGNTVRQEVPLDTVHTRMSHTTVQSPKEPNCTSPSTAYLAEENTPRRSRIVPLPPIAPVPTTAAPVPAPGLSAATPPSDDATLWDKPTSMPFPPEREQWGRQTGSLAETVEDATGDKPRTPPTTAAGVKAARAHRAPSWKRKKESKSASRRAPRQPRSINPHDVNIVEGEMHDPYFDGPKRRPKSAIEASEDKTRETRNEEEDPGHTVEEVVQDQNDMELVIENLLAERMKQRKAEAAAKATPPTQDWATLYATLLENENDSS